MSESWLDLYQETFSKEFSAWLRDAERYLATKTCYGYNVGDITRAIIPDLWDEEMESTKFVLYDVNWQNERCNLQVHPLFKMWKSGLEPQESIKLLLKDFKSHKEEY